LYPSWDGALAAELIRQFELPLDRRLRALSRGMKVKAALAASLAYRPRLIVLDEPFGGLDVLVREQLIESIVDCTPEATVLLASHDLAEIETFATHVGYLNEGRLEFVEEMGSLNARFREVEVTLEAPPGTAFPDSPRRGSTRSRPAWSYVSPTPATTLRDRAKEVARQFPASARSTRGK
jgi:ABC-2 type transport system ATP-binding protein